MCSSIDLTVRLEVINGGGGARPRSAESKLNESDPKIDNFLTRTIPLLDSSRMPVASNSRQLYRSVCSSFRNEDGRMGNGALPTLKKSQSYRLYPDTRNDSSAWLPFHIPIGNLPFSRLSHGMQIFLERRLNLWLLELAKYWSVSGRTTEIKK